MPEDLGVYCILEDSKFITKRSDNIILNVIGNNSLMLNDCEFTRYSDDAAVSLDFDVPRTSTQLDAPCHVYFMGKNSGFYNSLISNGGNPAWTNATRNEMRQMHQGAIKHYQVFKDGVPFSGIHYRMLSKEVNPVTNADGDMTIRPDIPRTDRAEILGISGRDATVNGQIEVATITKTARYENTVLSEYKYKENNLRLRDKTIDFHKIEYGTDILDTVGSKDVPIPVYTFTDKYFVEDPRGAADMTQAYLSFSLDFRTRTLTLFTLRPVYLDQIYARYKDQLVNPSSNFIFDNVWKIEDGVLDMGNWNIVFQNQATLNIGIFPNSVEVRKINTDGTLTLPASATSHVNITSTRTTQVNYTSNAPNTKILIEIGGTLELLERSVPVTREYGKDITLKIVAKAPGYIEKKYTINSNDDSLDIELEKDPEIEASLVTDDDLDVFFTITPDASGANDKSAIITMAPYSLRGELKHSKAIVDRLLSEHDGLEMLFAFTSSNITGDRPVDFRFGDMVIDRDWLRMIKSRGHYGDLTGEIIPNGKNNGDERDPIDALKYEARFGINVLSQDSDDNLIPYVSEGSDYGFITFDNEVLLGRANTDLLEEISKNSKLSRQILDNKYSFSPPSNGETTLTIYDDDDETPLRTFTLTIATGNRTKGVE